MKELIFDKETRTIRQMPENYLVANFNGFTWVCEPDLAANKETCVAVFLELMDFHSKYNFNGDIIINRIKNKIK